MAVESQAPTRTTWNIDAAHSLVEFSAKHMMFTTVKGRFTRVTGTVIADEATPAASTVEVQIEAASIDTGDANRDNHLRSADFLDVEKFPTLTFKSTRVVPVDAERLSVFGTLTVRGVSREVELTATFNGRNTNPFGKQVAGFTAETVLSRKEFGLLWNVALETGGVLVSDTVKVLLEIQLVLAA